MPGTRTVRPWMAAGALAIALTTTAGTAGATAFVASANFNGSSTGFITTDVSLPQYSGPGVISNVVLSISGVSEAYSFYEYVLDTGLTVNEPASWSVLLFTPNNASTAAVDASVNSRFVASIPPCSDPSCIGVTGFVTLDTGPASFSGRALASDLSDFTGAGLVDLTILVPASFDSVSVSGTATETILARVPEPSAWLMLLLGFGLLGAAMRRSRAAPARWSGAAASV